MKKNTLITSLMVICLTVFLSSCQKETVNPTSAQWSGIYQAPQGSQVSQVVISCTGNTLKVELKQIEFSYQYTSVILTNITPDPSTGIAKIDQQASIIEHTGTYQFKGTLTVNGSHVTLNSTASKADGSEADTKTYSFVGDKVQ